MSVEEIFKEAKSLSPDSQLVLAEMLMTNLSSDMPESIQNSHVKAVKARIKTEVIGEWVLAEDSISAARKLLK